MLQTQTVKPATLELLKKLSQESFMSDFALVWWTNLALRYGHRISLDLDFFSRKQFDPLNITGLIKKNFPNAKTTSVSEVMWFMMVDNIKVDLVYSPYNLIYPIEEVDKIRMMSTPDIVAFKLNAIARRWAKKDFWDIATLLDDYSIKEMLWFYTKKFDIDETWYVVRALTYFDDAEKETADPMSLKWQTRVQVKKKILKAVNSFADQEYNYTK